MDYTALIQNRKSARGFSDKIVTGEQYKEIRRFYENSAKRLVPEIKTEMVIVDYAAQRALEGAAGYENVIIGAPAYLVLMTEDKPAGIENACFIMEDIVLKLIDMGLGSCYITFADGERIKQSVDLAADQAGEDKSMIVAGIIAFGNELKLAKRMRFNKLTMGGISKKAKQHYFDPKKKLEEMVYLNEFGCTEGIDDAIGFYDSILWEALYAASLSPSYLNRQPYAFIVKDHKVYLVNTPDEYTDEVSRKQGLGIVMLHFAAVVEEVSHHEAAWVLGADADAPAVPAGYEIAASITL